MGSILIRFLVLISVTSLLGCGNKGWMRDRSQDYKEAKSSPRLKTEQALSTGLLSQEYQIPGE